MILTAPILAESHISKKSRFDMTIVIINELLISLTVKVQIQLLIIVIGELIAQEFVYQLLVVLCDFLGNRLSIIPP